MEEQLLFSDKEKFREWLIKNHAINKGIWLVFGKNVRVKTLTPDEALEEALCFGWIDGLIKRLDADRYLKKFSPRRKGSKWSARNKGIVDRLIKGGKMTGHGLKAIEEAKVSGAWDAPGRQPVTGSQIDTLVAALKGHEPALANYLKMAQSAQRLYAGFYLDAKSEDARQRRLQKMIPFLNENKKAMF
jgi:uncharacterized protein YdeI (YjbR/CyaY-like superfamily)